MTTSAAAVRTTQGAVPYRVGLGMSVAVVLALVLVAAPRAVAHDLQLLPPGSLGNTLLAIGPLVVWVAVAAVWSARPFVTLLAAGVGHGAVLALVHNLVWGTSFADTPPRLGGSLAGAFPAATEEVVMRGAATISSIATGALVGVVCGVIAWSLQAMLRRSGHRLPLARG